MKRYIAAAALVVACTVATIVTLQAYIFDVAQVTAEVVAQDVAEVCS